MSALAWLDLSELSHTVRLILFGFVVIAAAVAAALLSSLIAGLAFRLTGRALSRAGIFRARLVGGLAGAAAAYFLFGWGGGFGFGPGGAGRSLDDPNATGYYESSAAKQLSPRARTDAEEAKSSALRVRLLGKTTQPLFAEPDRVFAFADDPRSEAVSVEAVVKRARELKEQGRIDRVELVVSRESFLLQNPAVEDLKNRIVNDVGLRFAQPNPEDPFNPQEKLQVAPGRGTGQPIKP